MVNGRQHRTKEDCVVADRAGRHAQQRASLFLDLGLGDPRGVDGTQNGAYIPRNTLVRDILSIHTSTIADVPAVTPMPTLAKTFWPHDWCSPPPPMAAAQALFPLGRDGPVELSWRGRAKAEDTADDVGRVVIALLLVACKHTVMHNLHRMMTGGPSQGSLPGPACIATGADSCASCVATGACHRFTAPVGRRIVSECVRGFQQRGG